MKRLASFLLFASGMMCLVPCVFAQVSVPQLMNYQGRLATPNGNPVPDNPSQTITFRLYDALTGGNKLWEQLSTVVAVKNGTFATKFNFSTGFQGSANLSSVFNGNPVYLEIKVGNDAALTPRQQLASNAYAFLSNNAFSANNALHVSDGTITLSSLAPGVLNFNNIGGTVTNNQIGTGVITGDKIANNTINSWNLSSSLQSQLGVFGNTGLAIIGSVATTSPTEVRISGNYAYVSSYGYNYINVYNVASRTTPALVATIPCFRAYGLAINGTMLYVACSDNNLRLFDISTPTAPVTKGSVATAGFPFNLAVGGSYAYLPCNTGNTLQIFNVSNPNAPTLAAAIGTDNSPTNVTLSGNYAYVTCGGGNTLEIFNVSNPAGPTFVSRVATDSTPYDVKISGNYAYVINLNGQTLQTINIANPAAPSVVGSFALGFQPVSEALSGSTLYIGGLNKWLFELSIANTTPVYVAGFGGLAGDVGGITFDNGAVYATTITPGSLEVITDTFGLLTHALTVTDILTASNITGAGGIVNIRGQLNLDPNGVNTGNLGNGLVFGAAASGEGIASKRGSGGNNPYGLDLYTNFTPRLSVSNGGSVGIGTTNPANTLDVNGTATVRGDLRMIQRGGGAGNNGGNGRALVDAGNNTPGVGNGLVINYNNDFGVVTVGSNLIVSGTVTQSSDIRYKKNIAAFADPLESLLGLRGVSYEWRADEFKDKGFSSGKQLGFIAQEVEKIFPELVTTDAQGYKSVNYMGVIPVAVEAIKTLKAKNDALEAKLDAVMKRLDALESHSK